MSYLDPIVNISVFGSYGRGNSDANSDLDILVLCPDNGGTQSEKHVRNFIARHYEIEPSISWYGEEKLLHFFETGDLFAWHLFQESFPMPGFSHLKEIFGEPNAYKNCQDDINGLLEILKEIPNQISMNPQNMVYELGICYVCVRNIAMAASSVLCKKVDFGRYSPFSLPIRPLLISLEDYKVLASCRHASTRGFNAPRINIAIAEVLQKCIFWAEAVERKTR